MNKEIKLGKMFGMQRANGDWFALEDRKTFRVPVFSSSSDAMQARAFNPEMLLFKPVLLDERALKNLAAEENGDAAHFWLVDDFQVNLKRGHRLQYGQLTALCYEAKGAETKLKPA
jgi:hypothetical protein